MKDEVQAEHVPSRSGHYIEKLKKTGINQSPTHLDDMQYDNYINSYIKRSIHMTHHIFTHILDEVGEIV